MRLLGLNVDENVTSDELPSERSRGDDPHRNEAIAIMLPMTVKGISKKASWISAIVQ